MRQIVLDGFLVKDKIILLFLSLLNVKWIELNNNECFFFLNKEEEEEEEEEVANTQNNGSREDQSNIEIPISARQQNKSRGGYIGGRETKVSSSKRSSDRPFREATGS